MAAFRKLETAGWRAAPGRHGESPDRTVTEAALLFAAVGVCLYAPCTRCAPPLVRDHPFCSKRGPLVPRAFGTAHRRHRRPRTPSDKSRPKIAEPRALRTAAVHGRRLEPWLSRIESETKGSRFPGVVKHGISHHGNGHYLERDADRSRSLQGSRRDATGGNRCCRGPINGRMLKNSRGAAAQFISEFPGCPGRGEVPWPRTSPC